MSCILVRPTCLNHQPDTAQLIASFSLGCVNEVGYSSRLNDLKSESFFQSHLKQHVNVQKSSCSS